MKIQISLQLSNPFAGLDPYDLLMYYKLSLQILGILFKYKEWNIATSRFTFNIID